MLIAFVLLAWWKDWDLAFDEGQLDSRQESIGGLNFLVETHRP